MSVNIFTEWGPLKEIVVGDCFNIDHYNVDLSFKIFFNDNIKDELLKNSLPLQKRLVEQRHEDLTELAACLELHGVKVLRPLRLEKIEKFETPYFSDYLRPVDNPRDQTLVYADKIIETPCIWRSRYRENELMEEIFKYYSDKGAKRISAPRPKMKDESFDLSYIRRDQSKNIDWAYYDKLEKNFEMMFDAAQCLKFGKDIVMNISNENHRMGAVWLKEILGESVRLHTVELTDHHIDGMFMPLRPGLLLLNPVTMKEKIHLLPKELQKWDKISVPNEMRIQGISGELMLASENISVNVLSLSPEKVMIFEEKSGDATPLLEILEKKQIEAIVVRLRHSRLFGGGLHCATLDMRRDEVQEDYFS